MNEYLQDLITAARLADHRVYLIIEDYDVPADAVDEALKARESAFSRLAYALIGIDSSKDYELVVLDKDGGESSEPVFTLTDAGRQAVRAG